MAKIIRGKVARILNSREIALNLGSDDGVAVGMCFDIMDSKSEDIKDPDTGQILGSIERPKVRVKVTLVQEKLSLATTYKTRRINVGGTGLEIGVLSKAFMPPEWATEYETLRTAEQTWDDLDEAESYVTTGDPAVQVIEDTKDIPF